MERELDQLKFSSEAATRESNELLVGMKAQINHLKSENESLNKRLEKNIQESQKKLEFERIEHRKTKDRLRGCLEKEERMLIQIDNLSKKVKFFKANSQSKSNTKKKENEKEENFSLIETTKIKQYIAYLLDKVRTIKIQHNKEKLQLLEELKFQRSDIASMTNVLVIRVREETKKNKYLLKDTERLKSDIQKLQKINEELSIKFTSEKSLSKMTTVDFNSNMVYDSVRTFEKDNSSNYERKNHLESLDRYGASSQNYRLRDTKLNNLKSNSINSSSSLHFRSNFGKNSIGGVKDFKVMQKETQNLQDKLTKLRKGGSTDSGDRQISSRRINVYEKERHTVVPHLNFDKENSYETENKFDLEDQENMNNSNHFNSGMTSVRLLSQRMEKPNMVLGERNQNFRGSNWQNSQDSFEKRERKSYFGERGSFLKEGKDSFVSNEKYESRKITFGVLNEISEVMTPNKR